METKHGLSEQEIKDAFDKMSEQIKTAAARPTGASTPEYTPPIISRFMDDQPIDEPDPLSSINSQPTASLNDNPVHQINIEYGSQAFGSTMHTGTNYSGRPDIEDYRLRTIRNEIQARQSKQSNMEQNELRNVKTVNRSVQILKVVTNLNKLFLFCITKIKHFSIITYKGFYGWITYEEITNK